MSIFKRIFSPSREEPRWWDVDKPGDPELPGLEKPQTENSQKDFDGMIPPTALKEILERRAERMIATRKGDFTFTDKDGFPELYA